MSSDPADRTALRTTGVVTAVHFYTHFVDSNLIIVPEYVLSSGPVCHLLSSVTAKSWIKMLLVYLCDRILQPHPASGSLTCEWRRASVGREYRTNISEAETASPHLTVYLGSACRG